MSSLPPYLQKLEYLTRPYPAEAVYAAISHREECTPYLLQALEWVEANAEEANDAYPPYMLHEFALFLLAQFRETKAYPLLVKLCRHPQFEDLTGDFHVEHLRNVLGCVCGGDLTLIKSLIEDEEVDEWVRGAAVGSLGVLLRANLLSREEASAYFGQLFRTIKRERNFTWEALLEVCAEFRMIEHLDEIRKLYQEEIADPFYEELVELEEYMTRSPETNPPNRGIDFRTIDDTVEEMSSWHCFTKAAEEEDAREMELESESNADGLDSLGASPSEPGISFVRETPKVGRNDLCPCGSGKKYKKCCG